MILKLGMSDLGFAQILNRNGAMEEVINHETNKILKNCYDDIMSEEYDALTSVIENRNSYNAEKASDDTTAFVAVLSSEKVDELYEQIIEETLSSEKFSEIKSFAEFLHEYIFFQFQEAMLKL